MTVNGVPQMPTDLLVIQPLADFVDPAPAAPANSRPARTLREWLTEPGILEPPKIIVPMLAVEGRTTLLSGREKSGKSTLVGGAIAALSRGDPVLGVEVAAPIRSLWYSLDEPVADTVRRFDLLGAQGDLIAIDDEPRSPDALLAAIARDLDAHAGVGVVVIDTLSKLFEQSGIDANSSKEAGPVVGRIVDFLHKRNVAGILLYHTGKGGREYRGSTAIGATVDEVLTLRRRGQNEEDDFDDEKADDVRRLLIQDGRNLRGKVQLMYAGGKYRLFEDALAPRKKLLEVLRDHGSVTSRTELVKRAGVRKDTGLKVLAELIVEGLILEQHRRLSLTRTGNEQLAAELVPDPSERQDAGTAISPSAVPSSRKFPHVGTEPELKPEPQAWLGLAGSGNSQPPLGGSGTGGESGQSKIVRDIV
jgi:hypothetical protein